MKASSLLRLVACIAFLVAARLIHLAYEEDVRAQLIGVGVAGVVGVILLIWADYCGERKLW